MSVESPLCVLQVNGEQRSLPLSVNASLLHVLRNDLALNGPKYGCGLGQCGSCTVLIDGLAARACVVPAQGVQGRAITTLEGLGSREQLHPVQQAFIDEQAAQCGYCLNGMILMTVSLLTHTPDPTEEEIRSALSGNFCRCGTHVEIIRAVKRAAVLMQAPRPVSHDAP
jgi:nicotinate dehydrogenase subunit A